MRKMKRRVVVCLINRHQAHGCVCSDRVKQGKRGRRKEGAIVLAFLLQTPSMQETVACMGLSLSMSSCRTAWLCQSKGPSTQCVPSHCPIIPPPAYACIASARRSLERFHTAGIKRYNLQIQIGCHHSPSQNERSGILADLLDATLGHVDLALQPVRVLFHQAKHFVLHHQLLVDHHAHVLELGHRLAK